ncbi:CDP-glycerol glycerophosphotransferase family protein, partial [Staphylococcus shinii]
EVDKVEPFLDKHFKYHDGRSSERVVRNIFGS